MPDLLEWEWLVQQWSQCFWQQRATVWKGLPYGGIRRSMKRVFRPFRDFMLLEAAGFSEEDLAAAAETGICAGSQNDMIFSIICEELGLTGAFFLIGIFGLLMWRLMVIALHCRELQGTLLCVGIMSIWPFSDPEYCGGDKHHSKYRNHASLYQLWRNLSGVSSGRDGAGFERKQKMKFYHQSEIFAYNKR